MPPKIVRFNPRAHSFIDFRTGAEEVDEFFRARSDFNYRVMREKRLGDIYVAADGDAVVGCVAYLPRSAPVKIAELVAPALWGSRRRKPLDGGALDRGRELVIPAVRIVVLGVDRRRQGNGVGTALLRHVFSAVTAPFYYLHPVLEAVPFYEKHGFVQASAEFATIMFKVDAGEAE